MVAEGLVIALGGVQDVSEIVRARRKRQAELTAIVRSQYVVCAWCSSVRDDAGQWIGVERYVAENAFKRPTGALCPNCMEGNPEGQG